MDTKRKWVVRVRWGLASTIRSTVQLMSATRSVSPSLLTEIHWAISFAYQHYVSESHVNEEIGELRTLQYSDF